MAEDLGIDVDKESNMAGGASTSAFLVILFTGLGSIFAYAGYSGWMDLGEEAYFVAAIMGVLALAFLFAAFFRD